MTEKTPIVFISYSHDTPDHKRWVTEFASNLVKNGIDVKLDQWDISFGDDIPKYMEKSVTESDRVLMICSELYVAKANDGVGGVGYEAMVVTGELIRNLGTKKFIPIIKQKDNKPELPISVSTKFYVNLSFEDNYQFEFNKLLRELHKVPDSSKPAMGKNPFTLSPSKEEVPVNNNIESDQKAELFKEGKIDCTAVYRTALKISRNDEVIDWKELVRLVRDTQSIAIKSWVEKNGRNAPPLDSLERKNLFLQGASEWAPIMALAIAGVSSGRAKFNNQVTLFEEILYPKGWNLSGYVVVTRLPETAAFIYQAIHGAICIHTDQIETSTRFVRSKVTFPGENVSTQIWRRHSVMGWPPSLGENSTEAWNIIINLPDEWPWLNEIFGNKEEFQTALVAYYMLLNINEYAYLFVDGHIQSLKDNDSMNLDIPLGFVVADERILRRAYRLLLQNSENLMKIWTSLNIATPEVKSVWNKWVTLCQSWIQKVFFSYSLRGGLPHAGLMEDITFH